jgi:hypothetical protein
VELYLYSPYMSSWHGTEAAFPSINGISPFNLPLYDPFSEVISREESQVVYPYTENAVIV